MHPTRSLAAFALAAALCSCQNEPTASEDTSGKGALALAFAGRTLEQVRTDSDSLLLTLVGPKDTIRSIAFLGDTVRFDGLRTGAWSIGAELFSNDSGTRDRHWEGSASTQVEPGRVARVPLTLHRATGSLVIEIEIDDGETDTPIVIVVPPDTPAAIVPPIDLSDSARWEVDDTRYILVPGFDTSGVFQSARVLSSWPGRMGLYVKVALRGQSVAPAGGLFWASSACLTDSADTTCRPNGLRIVARRTSSRLVANDTAIRVVDVLIEMTSDIDRRFPLKIVDDYGTTTYGEDLLLDNSRCEHEDGGLVVCYDVAGFNQSYYSPFDRN